MNNYVGKLVFVEKLGKPNYSIPNGEYIIVEQSENNLFGISTLGGYNSRELKTIPIAGEDKFNVVSANYNPKFVREFTERLRKEGEKPKRGEKLNWVEYVYNDMLAMVERLERLTKEDEVGFNVLVVLHMRNGEVQDEQVFGFYDGQFPGLVISDGTGD